MRENAILKIALIFSLIGLIALYFVSERIEVKEYTGRSINSNIGYDVKLQGIVKNVKKTQNAALIDVEQKVPLKVVVLKNDINLTAGETVEVIGEVQEYNGNEEIMANRIRVVR